jgi:c-di-GMP-binding flagellar brake protein YcgR
MIQFEAKLGTGKLMRICQTSNVSESGLLIHTTRLIPLQTEMDVSFYLPGDPRPIDGKVRVVRHSDPQREEKAGMGVEFVHLPQAGREKLRDFVDGKWVETEDLISDAADGLGGSLGQRPM